MKAQGPLQDLPVLLQQIYDDLQKQHDDNEDQHDRDVEYCDTTLESLKSSITEHTGKYAFYKQEVKDTTAALEKLYDDLAQNEADIKTNERRTEEGTAQRQQQHDLYVKDLADNNDAIEACSLAIQLLNSLRSGTSFVQLKSKFEKVTEKLQSTKSINHAHIYTPIIKALAQISSKADQEIIIKILNLLDSLLKQLKEAKTTIENTEKEQADSWATALQNLKNEHDNLTARNRQLKEDIKQKEDNLESAKKNEDHHAYMAYSEAKLYSATQSECESKQANYEKVKAEL